MASRYKFVVQLPEDFMCPVCLDAVYDTMETQCCGVLLCKLCSDKLIASKMDCPQCKVSPLVTHANQFMGRKLRQLHVYCGKKFPCLKGLTFNFPINPNGDVKKLVDTRPGFTCTWSGEINDLQSHLEKHCPATAVTCKYGCGVMISRGQKDNHKSKVCRKRPFSCWFCDKKATAEEIDCHAINCDKRPIKCPNKCQVNEMLQEELHLHIQQCPLQVISCEFEHAGCKERILRKDYDDHIEDDTRKHLGLLSRSLATAAEKANTMENKANKMENKVKKMEENASTMENKVKRMEKRLCWLSSQQVKSITVKIPGPVNLSTRERSDPFYILGYCMTMDIDVCFSTYTSASYIELYLEPGRHDDDLSWPVEGVVKAVLLHPKDSSKNLEYTFNIRETERPSAAVRVCSEQTTDMQYIMQYAQITKDFHVLVETANLY